MFVPVVLCTSLENLMRPMLQVFTSTFSMGSIPKGLFLQLHVKVHVVPHCTKTDFCWMIASQPAPLLLVRAWFPTSPLCTLCVRWDICIAMALQQFTSAYDHTLFFGGTEVSFSFPQGSSNMTSTTRSRKMFRGERRYPWDLLFSTAENQSIWTSGWHII